LGFPVSVFNRKSSAWIIPGALAPTTLETCISYNPGTGDVVLSTNVTLAAGSMGDIMKNDGSVSFDRKDWEMKKGDAFIEFDFTRKMLLQVIFVTTTGVKSATLFAKDDEGSEYVKSVQQVSS
jgi:hypothetical protein